MESNGFSTNILFSFSCPKVNCLVDVSHNDTGAASYTFRVQAKKAESINYAYYSQKGLCRLPDKSEVVSRLSILDVTNVNDVEKFILEYGFFFPCSTDHYYSFSFDAISAALIRYQDVVLLLCSITENNSDAVTLFRIMKILFSTIHVTLPPDGDDQYIPYPHPFTKMLQNLESIDTLNHIHETPEVDGLGYFEIYDTVHECKDTVYAEDYHYTVNEWNESIVDYRRFHEIIDEAEENKIYLECFTKAFLMKGYVHMPPSKHNTKLIFDLMQSLLDRNNRDYIYDFLSAISNHPYSKDCGLDLSTYILSIDNKQKAAILTVAKNTLKDELDYNLHSVTPIYDINTMGPAWNIPDLFTAAWFSIFYLRTDYEMYRFCANPNCKNTPLFTVTSTNQRKIYCCDACRNAAAQLRHNRKKKLTIPES